MISPGIEPETSFQSLILKTAPSYLHGIIFAALLAAFLSSADTCLLTSAVIMTNDILNPVLFSNKLDDGKKLLLTKWMVIICGIVSLIIALYVNGILNSLFLALSVYTSGIVLPVVMGFYRDKLKLNRWGAMAGIAAGGTSCLYMKYMEMDQFMPYIFPAVLVIIIIVSRITAAAGTDFKRL
jgi:SSS family solute:Na+ symporter